MAVTNYERVGKGLDLLRTGLAPFVERELKNCYRARALNEALNFVSDDRNLVGQPLAQWDVAALLKLMWNAWNDVFRQPLGSAERSLVSELRDFRNRWAHQQTFSTDDAYRALDSAGRLLISTVHRLTGTGGDPVVQLQTNFSGGKTHSMLALYHLFSGTAPRELLGVEEILQEAGGNPVLPIAQAQFVARDTVARAFYDLYRTQHQEFPPECRDADYEKRLKAAYPIHPEVFDRLYTTATRR